MTDSRNPESEPVPDQPAEAGLAGGMSAPADSVPRKGLSDRTVAWLIFSGLVLIMAGLVIMPAVVLGHGPALDQARLRTMSLAVVDPSASWELLEAAGGFDQAYRSGNQGVFFFQRPLGTQQVHLALVMRPEVNRVVGLDVPGLPSPGGLEDLLDHCNQLLSGKNSPGGMLVVDPVERLADDRFRELLAQASRLMKGKGKSK